MKKFVLAGLSMVAFASAANAQDTAPAATFTGPYVGASVGFAKHENSYTDVDYWYQAEGAEYNSTSEGLLIGIQGGYNYQTSSNIVVGVEADLHYSTGKSTALVNSCDSECTDVKTKARWMSSLRARLGYATGNAMIYATGGLAYGNPKSNWREEDGDDEGHFDNGGWETGYVLGAGVEYAISPKMSARVQGLYYDLGSAKQTHEDDYTMKIRNEQVAISAGLNFRF